jgi:hypothetical protein
MTNLSSNTSAFIAMNNWHHIDPDLDKIKKIETFAKIKPIFLLHFEQFVEDCCQRIDLEFGLQLGKVREKISKDQYVKLLEYVRANRQQLKKNYIAKVNGFFDDPYNANNQNSDSDLSNAALISEDAIKENHAINLIIRQCEHALYEELISLNKKFGFRYGKQTIADSQNPIFPEKLIRALVETVSPLKLNANAKIALYRTFDVKVFKHMGFIYGELMTRCENTSTARFTDRAQHMPQRSSTPAMPLKAVVENKKQENAAKSELPSAEFKILQKKLDLWRLAHAPSAYDLTSKGVNAFYEQVEIKNALQALQSASDNPESRKQPLKWRVVKKLDHHSFSIDSRMLAKHDEDVLDLVALVCDEIEHDESLTDAVKTAILRLELPLAAASLGNYGVFTSRDNPVRQLIDELFASGMYLNPDEPDDQLIQGRIAGVVKKMADDCGFEVAAWSKEADEFCNYMAKQKQRSQRIEQNAKQFMITEQALVLAGKTVAATVANRIEGKKLPTAIAEFLRDVWVDVLRDAYIAKDEQPELWQKSLLTMDELIKSVMPPADDKERKQILKLLPGMIAELKSGLKRISYDKTARSRFFKELAVWHIILMDKNEAGKAAGYIDKDNAAAVDGNSIKAEAITDDSSEQAENLALDSWVAFSSRSGKQWAKLLWKDAQTKAMLFVGKNGAKILEMQTDELAEKLRKQQAVIAKNNGKTISERVLTKIMGL